MNARIDSLEPRVMLAVNAPVGVNLAYGLLTVTGTENADTINFGRLFIPLPFGLSIDWTTVEFNGVTKWYQTRTINRTLIRAGGGDDVINATTMPKAMTVYGGPGFDTIKTGEANDLVYGEEGQAEIEGNGGNDTLWGNTTADVIRGGEGNDCVYGGAGDDEVYGDGGSDSVAGDSGNDLIRGGTGDDMLAGWYGDDSIFGDAGNDNLFGQFDDDCLYGGTEMDTMEGGSGRDGLYGGFGIDSLTGGSEADRFLDFTVMASGLRTWEDVRVDYVADDALIGFENAPAQTGLTFTGLAGTYDFAAGTWSQDEIQLVDSPLHVLHLATNNDNLLETSVSTGLFYRRAGAQNGGTGTSVIGGWNSGGGILSLPDSCFTSENATRQIVLHEVGHNWDTEYDAANWRTLSGWVVFPTSPGFNYTRGGDVGVPWWYLNNAGFVSGYAKTNPDEDFAESFAAYFMKQGGWTFSESSIDTVVSKRTFLDGLVTFLS